MGNKLGLGFGGKIRANFAFEDDMGVLVAADSVEVEVQRKRKLGGTLVTRVEGRGGVFVGKRMLHEYCELVAVDAKAT